MKRGRKSEPSKEGVYRLIAALVLDCKDERGSVREAQKSVAKYLRTSESTVRRAWAQYRGDEKTLFIATFRLRLPSELADKRSNAERQALIEAARELLATTAASRGKRKPRVG